jgi:hypothetical protein
MRGFLAAAARQHGGGELRKADLFRGIVAGAGCKAELDRHNIYSGILD